MTARGVNNSNFNIFPLSIFFLNKTILKNNCVRGIFSFYFLNCAPSIENNLWNCLVSEKVSLWVLNPYFCQSPNLPLTLIFPFPSWPSFSQPSPSLPISFPPYLNPILPVHFFPTFPSLPIPHPFLLPFPFLSFFPLLLPLFPPFSPPLLCFDFFPPSWRGGGESNTLILTFVGLNDGWLPDFKMICLPLNDLGWV